MEQKRMRARYDEFAEQFVSLLGEHWADILLVIHRQSPRVATLLSTAVPTTLRRSSGVWRIYVAVKNDHQYEKLQQPRDNEIIAQAIRLFYHNTAQFKLPRIVVEFKE